MKRKTRGWLVSSEPDPWPALGQLSAPVFPSCAWPVAALGPRPLRWAWPVRVTGRGPGVGAGTVGRPIEAMAAVFCGGSCVPVAPLRLPWTASPRIPVGWHRSRGCLLPQLPSSPAPQLLLWWAARLALLALLVQLGLASLLSGYPLPPCRLPARRVPDLAKSLQIHTHTNRTSNMAQGKLLKHALLFFLSADSTGHSVDDFIWQLQPGRQTKPHCPPGAPRGGRSSG